jgi:hypothetical protein
VIVTNKENPYVLGTRLRVNHDKIAEIEILWTTTGYWLFNADTYLQYSSAEKWDIIPTGKRDTRDTLAAAANAYLDAFLEQKMDLVPWGFPCNRTEGGMHTGSGAPDTHLFRVENGKLRYVHTLTHLLQANVRGGQGVARGVELVPADVAIRAAERRRTIRSSFANFLIRDPHPPHFNPGRRQ